MHEKRNPHQLRDHHEREQKGFPGNVTVAGILLFSLAVWAAAAYTLWFFVLR